MCGVMGNHAAAEDNPMLDAMTNAVFILNDSMDTALVCLKFNGVACKYTLK